MNIVRNTYTFCDIKQWPMSNEKKCDIILTHVIIQNRGMTHLFWTRSRVKI